MYVYGLRRGNRRITAEEGLVAFSGNDRGSHIPVTCIIVAVIAKKPRNVADRV